jgi:maleylpyruvate isomerase
VLTVPGFDHYADGAAAAADLSARLRAADQALAATVAGVTDEQARAPSLLPGWTRGHVLTHLARNADSLRNLLIWARTGTETPQYASAGERDAGIAAGAGRPATELRADVEAAAAEFAAEAASLRAGDWDVPVHGLRGPDHPAWYTLWRRLTEVEFHHVDLGAGYRPADWPDAFARQGLTRLTVEFQRPDAPRVILRATDAGSAHLIGPLGSNPVFSRPEISGPTAGLLAWLIGRDDGAGLSVQPPGPLPAVPAW